jgi:hypothetical protein
LEWKGKGFHSSQNNLYLYYKNMETKKCLSCGKEFSKPKRKTKKEFINQKYCSR